MNETPGIRCYTPERHLLPVPQRHRGDGARRASTDVEDFRRAVLHDTGVSVCSRVHFGRPQPGESEQYVRLAYSGIDTPTDRRGARAPEGLSHRRRRVMSRRAVRVTAAEIAAAGEAALAPDRARRL